MHFAIEASSGNRINEKQPGKEQGDGDSDQHKPLMTGHGVSLAILNFELATQPLSSSAFA
jgi:hypothetical protein